LLKLFDYFVSGISLMPLCSKSIANVDWHKDLEIQPTGYTGSKDCQGPLLDPMQPPSQTQVPPK